MAEGGEVGHVVGAEDAVDGELGAEGAEITTGQHERLQGEDDGYGFFEGGLDDDFAAGRIQHVLFGDLSLVVSDGTGMFARRLEAEFLLRVEVGGARGAGGGDGGFAVGEGAGDVDDVARDAVAGEVLLGVQVALRPFPARRVRAEDEHGDGGGGDEDEGHDEGDAPGDVRGEPLVQDQAVEDGGHEEVGDAAAGVAETAGEGVGGPDDVFVEEARRPDLAGYEGAAEDADEEAQGHQPGYVGYGSCEGGGDSAGEETAGEGVAGAEAVAGGTGDEADEETVGSWFLVKVRGGSWGELT